MKEGLRPFLVTAGILLVAAALATLWYEFKGPHLDDDGHGHSHGGPKVAWLLLLPVLGLLLVAPPALGSYSAGRTGTALPAGDDDYAPLPDGDPVKISVLDYASRAVFDGGRSLANRRVEISGCLTTAPDGSWYLTRMLLTCCAADARPIKVALSGDLPDPLTEDGWLLVTGRYLDKTAKDAVNGERIPYLDVEQAETIPAPAEPYKS